MGETEKSGQVIKSAEKTLQIMELLFEYDGMTASELAEVMDTSPSTAYRYLKTLENRGYAVEEDNCYYLGLRFLQHSRYIQERKKEYTMARPIVQNLAEETGERCQFYVLENRAVVAVCRETGDRGVLTDSQVGKELPIHATSAGKSILAFMPESKRSDLIQELTLTEETEKTLTEVESLKDELSNIRDQGVSYNLGEYIEKLHGISIPIRQQERVAGTLTVSGPAHRLTEEVLKTETLETLRGYANELELKIVYE